MNDKSSINVKQYTTGPIDVNTYLVFDDSNEAFIVDPGGYSQQLVEFIKAKHLYVKYIILTHGHADHIGGVEEMLKVFPETKIIAHKKAKELLTDPAKNASNELFFRPITLEADIYVSDSDTKTVGNMELKFIYTPGHTKGGMCILIPGILFSGDTIFNASIGRTDFYGGSFEEIVNSIKQKIFTLPNDTVIYPGHMESTTVQFEKRYNPFVKD